MNILSVDGGATQTRGIVFSSAGAVSAFEITEPTSLSRPDDASIDQLTRFMPELASSAELALDDMGLIALGLAGVSDENARERLFKAMDKLGVGERLVVTSDVEAAYETIFGNAAGVLVSVGTGAIGWARDKAGNSYRASGRGPQLGGDPGSGYWLGKNLMVRLIMMETQESPDLESLREKVMAHYDAADFEEAAQRAGETSGQLHVIAGLGRMVCEEAAAGNEVALSLVQEGTLALAEDLLEMVERADLKSDPMTIGINGSIIVANPIFRQLLADGMMYDIPTINWRTATLDPAFGAGLLAARLREIPVDMQALQAAWEQRRVPANG
ncbi:MAG: hypothetical protein IIA59_06490 [Candidatus Marinimicrobia bacterium]|nr:hypothetical protein [Candidatus Neomarinimicrobiota bacterium]